MIFNSIYEPTNPLGGVLGTSLIDLTSTSFAQMFANAVNFSPTGNYIVGDLVYDQGAVWVCKVATSGANPPPTLPTLRNAWWEFVGSQGTFTWIAYADSPTGFIALPSVSITGTAGQFSCTASTIAVGDIVTISGTLSGTGTITGYGNKATSYVVSATNGTTTFTLTNPNGSAIVTTAGTTVGLTFTRYTLSDFTTDLPGTRKYIGIASNKTTATESTYPADYIWSRFVGQDGTVGVSPILISLSRPAVAIGTDSNGDNGVFTGSGTEIRILEGQTTLAFDGSGVSGTGNANGGTLLGTWKVSSRVATGVTIGSAITDDGTYATVDPITAISADTGSIVYTITGTNSSGVGFTTTATQTFVRLKGAVVDINPPGVPTGLALVSSFITTPAGDIQVKLSASWATNSEPDFSYYIVAIQEGTGTFIEYNTTSTSYEWIVKPRTSYTVKVKGVDKSDNRSQFSGNVTLISAEDSTPPAAPTNVSAVATFKSVFLNWTNPAAADLAYVEVWRNTTNNSATATKISTVNAVGGTAGSFTDSSNLTNGTLYYYWLKAIDTSGNTSTAFSTLTTSTLSSVQITGISGQFSCASTPLKIGQVLIISGTLGGTGTITGYTTPKTYVISATNGTTTFTLVNADGTALVTTAGTLTGLTYTKHETAAVPAAVGTADIIAGSITADRIRTGELTADLIAIPAAGKFMNPSIQVGATTGITLGTIQSDAATGAQNPTVRINAGSTTIDPGKILISGSTTLANWRNGTDATKIEGGSIAANTVSANKLEVGIRGVDISGITFQCSVDATTKASTNIVTWTAGTIVYTNDAGSVISVNIDDGAMGSAWTSGIVYFYWTKGGTVIQTSTASGDAYGADKIVLATYAGGFNLVVNYGRTIIDGSQITTGTITGTQVKANSITASQINSNGLSIRDTNGNIILAAGSAIDFANLSSSFPGATNTGSVSNSNITISNGAISGIGTGSGTVVDNTKVVVGGKNLVLGTASGIGWSGFTTRTGSTYTLTAAAATETAYIYSPYFNMWGNQEITLSFESKEDASITGRDLYILPDNYPAIGLISQSFSKAADWTKYSFTFTTPSTWGLVGSPASVRVRFDHNGSTGGVSATIYVRNIKVELGNKATDWSPAPEDLVSVDLTNAPSGIKNANISIGTDGSLSGAGGGQVTIGGLGYSGDLNATYGASFGPSGNISGQITEATASTYIADAAIGSALIGSVALVGASKFSVKTSQYTDQSRIEMNGQVIKIFEGSTLRVKIGNLAA